MEQTRLIYYWAHFSKRREDIDMSTSLSALVKLISDARKVVESHFVKSSKPYVPSLDDTEPHPLDGQPAEKEL